MKYILLTLGLILFGCDKQPSQSVLLPITEDTYIYQVEIGVNYIIPLVLQNDKTIPISIIASPAGSAMVENELGVFLQWTPRQIGTFDVVFTNPEHTFSQTYVLIVGKE